MNCETWYSTDLTRHGSYNKFNIFLELITISAVDRLVCIFDDRTIRNGALSNKLVKLSRTMSNVGTIFIGQDKEVDNDLPKDLTIIKTRLLDHKNYCVGLTKKNIKRLVKFTSSSINVNFYSSILISLNGERLNVDDIEITDYSKYLRTIN